MSDFATARRMMVDGQVRTNDVTDPRLLAAMLDLPREGFVPRAKRGLAYLDLDVPVSDAVGGKPARRLLKPMTLAKLIQTVGPGEKERILDVGCATGYSSVLLARLAASVVGLEVDPVLASQAKAALAEAGAGNVEVMTGPLAQGSPNRAPYDVIVVEGAVEFVPQSLFDQLGEGGRLTCVLGAGPAAKAVLYRRDRGAISGRPVFDAAADVLPGFARAPEFVF